jgi:hypothetical protein
VIWRRSFAITVLPWLVVTLAVGLVLVLTNAGAETWVAGGTFMLAFATAALALSTRREAQASLQQVEISRRALQAGSRPLLVDAPKGVFFDEHSLEVESGSKDRGAVIASSHQLSGPDDAFGYVEFNVPLQNVGSGVALIDRFVMRDFPINAAWSHTASQSVVPVGQLVTLRMSADIDPGDAQALEIELRQDHHEVEVEVWYTDLAGEQRSRTRLLVEGDHGRWRPTRIFLYEGDASEPFADLRREIIVVGLTSTRRDIA